MKLLLFPLMIMFIVAMLSTAGLGSSLEGEQDIYLLGDASQGYFDSTGHQVAYANQSDYDEAGDIHMMETATASGPWNNIVVWDNGTQYPIFDAYGENMIQKDNGSFNLYTTEGLIAIIAVVAIIGGVVGVFAGDLGASLAFKGGVLAAIWGIFSVINLTLITSIPLIGPIFYVGLTVMYAMGIINQVGSPESV